MVREVLRKYAVFSGRSHRTEFWMYTLVSSIIAVVLTVIDYVVGLDPGGVGVLSTIYSLAVLLPGPAVGARRLHDTERSGWRQLQLAARTRVRVRAGARRCVSPSRRTG